MKEEIEFLPCFFFFLFAKSLHISCITPLLPPHRVLLPLLYMDEKKDRQYYIRDGFERYFLLIIPVVTHSKQNRNIFQR